MKTEARIFLAVAVFLFVSAAVYGWWSADDGKAEVIGITCLILSGGLTLIVGGYCGFVARRIGERPEDRHDAEIADGAGELGFFSPGSYWPFGLGLAAFIGGIALAFFLVWLIIIAIAAIMLAVGGLLFEYYAGQNEASSNLPTSH